MRTNPSSRWWIEQSLARCYSDGEAAFILASPGGAADTPCDDNTVNIDIVRGDITTLHVDAIVNAANTTLLGGGGVDGAIHRAAGPELLAECRALGGCQPGEAKITRGYKLPVRYVIHTVGPFWTGGKRGEPQILTNCYRNSLLLCVENRIKTIAFPAISCGAYGYPIREATRIAVETTREFLATDDKIDKVIFVVASDEILRAYQRLL
jgi:O-acetyl-ADP-ribose deacetylase (regulator of RNase III)